MASPLQISFSIRYVGKQNHVACIDEKKNLCMLLNKDKVSSTTWEYVSNISDGHKWRTKTIDQFVG